MRFLLQLIECLLQPCQLVSGSFVCHPNSRHRPIQQVNSRVGQTAVFDVSLRQQHRLCSYFRTGSDGVMLLVERNKGSHHSLGNYPIGFVYPEHLEPPVKSFFFLDKLSVFFVSGGPDHGNFATSQFGLQQVGCSSTHRTFRVKDEVQFVNKKDSFAKRLDFFDNIFQTIFHFPLVGSTGDQRSQVKLE